KLFKGFAPEIALGKHIPSPENNTIDLEIDFTGVWNGVSNERRSQVKDLKFVYPVEGSADVEVIDESGKVVKVFNGVAVENNSLKFTLNTNGLKEGYYGLKISYLPDNANPLYAETAKTFEKAVRVASLQASITPENVTAEPGQKVNFTVNASGGKAPYTYKWMVRHSSGKAWVILNDSSNYQDIAKYQGQGTNTLTCTLLSAGSKDVVCQVTDANGMSVTADLVTFTVRKGPELVIKTQPKSVTIATGQKATLTVAASGGKAPYTYTWQTISSLGSWYAVQNNSNYSGQGTNTFTFTHDKPGTAKIRCIVKDANGDMVTSDEVTITVKTAAAPLSIKTHPKSITVEAGETATFTVAASGGKAPYTYTWQMPSGSNWIAVQNGSGNSGQGTDTFNFKTESPVSTRVRCVVKDANGNTVTSDTATITVKATEPLSIKSQPQSITITEGHPALFKVVASGGKAPYTYIWQTLSGRNWRDIPEQIQFFGPQILGQGKDTLLCMEMPEGVVKLRCVIRDANGKEVISDTATLTVNAKVTPLVITSQPMDTTLETGGNSGVYVEVSGGKAPYTYTWQTLVGNNWNTLRDSAQVFGQGTNALICAPTEAGIVAVRCVIKDASGQEVISGAATITVKAAPLTAKIVQPTDVTVEAGETVRFTVEVSGGQAPYTYRWEGLVGQTWRGIRESASHKGQGSNTLSCTPNDGGRTKYHCVVTDSAGNTVTTETVSVTVKPLSVQINNGETEITFYHTETETLTANVTGGVGPYTYTWYRYRYIWNTKSYEWEKVSEASSYKADGAPREDYRVKVEVKDSTGKTVTAEIYVRLTGIVN
ncbi:MAG: hypothetical protein IKD37_05040, partial [Clostridia bacterium]|nr:hypothetical protein [Clostridia bacterium]